jgi:hypothetical protein
MLWYNVAMKEFDELKQEALKPLVPLVEKLARWLRNHIHYYKSEYGNRHLRIAFGRHFVSLAWGTNVASGEIEEVDRNE